MRLTLADVASRTGPMDKKKTKWAQSKMPKDAPKPADAAMAKKKPRLRDTYKKKD